ncbi:hypothetical protein [Desulfobulbus sp.]|uniref:hypothetical protein n=1 Tax=Desulfobulbus sp. TaxID=895 RepID=UPI00286F2A9E|nr:hypothetical protein [Desulfobulbus sp.]
MEIKDYCNNVDLELSTWKAKLMDVLGKIEPLSTGRKEGIFEEINGLQIVLTELEDRIEKLRTECPLAWKPERASIEKRMAELSERYSDARMEFFDYEFGG